METSISMRVRNTLKHVGTCSAIKMRSHLGFMSGGRRCCHVMDFLYSSLKAVGFTAIVRQRYLSRTYFLSVLIG